MGKDLQSLGNGPISPPSQLPLAESQDFIEPQCASEWLRIKHRLRAELDEETYVTWISPLMARKDLVADELVITLPNLVLLQGLHDRFLAQMERIKDEEGYANLQIRFELAADNNGDNQSQLEPRSSYMADGGSTLEERRGEIPSPRHGAFSRTLSSEGHLNRAYTFGNFIRGESNSFAVATCLAAAENPGRNYNPLFIYGSSGLGKTHLLHAVGNMVLKNNPSAVVAYVTTEVFMNELVYSIRHSRTYEFRQKYRNCDVFLVDDIQFIAGKSTTQEEFFHTFNALHNAKKQIVITSDMFPKDIPELEDRLRNRFAWGLIADIQPPSLEHRVAILLSKADESNLHLPKDVAEYIASRVRKNVRELEGALRRIKAFADLQGEPITLDLATQTFRDFLGETPRRLTIESIQKAVADHFKLKVADLRSKRRQQSVAMPRQVAMYLARKITQASYPDIGQAFGGKDHTTVMHNVKKIQECLVHDLDLKAHVDTLERQLEQLQ